MVSKLHNFTGHFITGHLLREKGTGLLCSKFSKKNGGSNEIGMKFLIFYRFHTQYYLVTCFFLLRRSSSTHWAQQTRECHLNVRFGVIKSSTVIGSLLLREIGFLVFVFHRRIGLFLVLAQQHFHLMDWAFSFSF